MKKIDFPDILIFLGLAQLGTGLWLYEPWVSLTVCGSILLLFGIRGSKK